MCQEAVNFLSEACESGQNEAKEPYEPAPRPWHAKNGSTRFRPFFLAV
jgi:hypothetical protein